MSNDATKGRVLEIVSNGEGSARYKRVLYRILSEVILYYASGDKRASTIVPTMTCKSESWNIRKRLMEV